MLKPKSRKGAAMEMAIITLLEIFGFCLILLTVAEMTASVNRQITDETQKRTDIEQIGDLFVQYCMKGQYDSFSDNMYAHYSISKNRFVSGSVVRYAVTIRSKDDFNKVLCIFCDENGNILRRTNHVMSFDRLVPKASTETMVEEESLSEDETIEPGNESMPSLESTAADQG